MKTTAHRAKNGLSLTAYTGDGAVLLGYSLDKALVEKNDLAGFAIQCTPEKGNPYYLLNRLNFTHRMTSETTPAERTWTPSDQAPFQKFHWVHFPPNVITAKPQKYNYKLTARYFTKSGLEDGPSAEIAVELPTVQKGDFEFGFTRGYLTSQAYAVEFQNKPIRPAQKTLDFNTADYEKQYAWLGFHARKLIFDFMAECLRDKEIAVDLFAYDLDEPEFIRSLEKLGPRLRAFLDNAPLHTKTGALEIEAHARLVKSAGAANVKQGHFHRFAHDKILIMKKGGKAIKVLTGSANFSIRGLYVQANNVLVFNDLGVADLYEQVFQSVFTDMAKFTSTPLSQKWFDFQGKGLPMFGVSFAPHHAANISLDRVEEALHNAKSSVLFAVMELGGGGPVLHALRDLHTRGDIFSYGMTQSEKGVNVYKPGQDGILVPFAALDKHVPPPFDKEWRGGMGQVIHDKFIVIDFNDEKPVVFTGSSNLAEGGEQANGDNLLAIEDPLVASAFAVEALRLVDHYHFRAAMQSATHVQPLQLAPSGTKTKWWQPYYDPKNVQFHGRLLFSGEYEAKAAIAA